MLTRAAGQGIPVPVRFGGGGAPEHLLLLRFGPVEQDGSVRGYLLADVRGTRVAVRNAVVWDPLLECFAWGDQAGVDRLAAQLDPPSAALGFAGRGAAEVVRVVDVVAGLLSPGFILVGGVLGVLAAYLVYYPLWITLAGWAFWYVILPGGAIAVACLVVREARLRRLRAGLFEAAYAALGLQGPV